VLAFALGRRAWLFAGSDRGGERAAAMFTLIETAKLNDVDPEAWLADVLRRIADHPALRLRELLLGTGANRRSGLLLLKAPTAHLHLLGFHANAGQPHVNQDHTSRLSRASCIASESTFAVNFAAGVKSPYEAMITEIRHQVRLKAIEKISSNYNADSIARGLRSNAPHCQQAPRSFSTQTYKPRLRHAF